MADITVKLDKIKIKRMIVAYNASLRIKTMVKELYIGISEEPCQDTLLSDIQFGLCDYVSLIREQAGFASNEEMAAYMGDKEIDIDTKTETIYNRIIGKGKDIQ